MNGRTAFYASVLSLLLLAGCSDNGKAATSDDDDDGGTPVGDLPLPDQGFQILTPDIEIAPGQEITYCYYLQMPTTSEAGVRRWQSKMTPGSHHMILYFTQVELQPAGTVTSDSCGSQGSASDLPVWTYSAQSPDNAAAMPDGVGMVVPAGQPAFIQMHYLNASETPITVHVTLNGETYDEEEAYTPAAAFVTYNTTISVPPNDVDSVSGSCSVPAGAQFFAVSTHAHKQAILTRVSDGAAVVFESDDWEHPIGQTWESPFYTFSSNALTYQCDYVNPTDATINTGPSAETDEMCMAVGYFFPAESAKFCVNSTMIN